jgi:hypothetical protein
MGVGTKLKKGSRSGKDEEYFEMLKDMASVAKARKEMLIAQADHYRVSMEGCITRTSSHPMTRCIDLLNELVLEIDDDVYLKAVQQLMDEQFSGLSLGYRLSEGGLG